MSFQTPPIVGGVFTSTLRFMTLRVVKLLHFCLVKDSIFSHLYKLIVMKCWHTLER